MADKAFDRVVINQYERPLSQDANREASQLDRTLRDVLRDLFSAADGTANSGFIQHGFKVVQSSPAGMSVSVSPGFGFEDSPSDVPASIGGVVGVDDLSTYKPLVLVAAQPVAVDAAPGAGQERIDIIEVQVVDRRLENPTSRDVFNPGTGIFAPNLVNKTLAFYLDGLTGRVVTPNPSATGIGYKVGAAAAVGFAVAPPTTAGYVKICEILVSAGATSIVDADITDSRVLLGIGAIAPGAVGTPQLVDHSVTAAKVADHSLTTAQLAASAGILKSQLAAVGQQVSASSGTFSTTSPTYVDVTNLTVTIATGGRPVFVGLQGTTSNSRLGLSAASSTAAAAVRILRDSTTVMETGLLTGSSGSAANREDSPGSVWALDAAAAGTHVYKVQAKADNGATTVWLYDCVLVAYEL